MSDTSGPGGGKGKSFFSLLTDVPHLITQLIRAELELLKAELVSKLKATGIGLGLFAISISLIVLALLLLVLAGVFALSLVLPLWAAALIAAGGVLIVAIVVAAVGGSIMSGAQSPKPSQTVESIREDIRTIRGKR
jgi:hypothetical protein